VNEICIPPLRGRVGGGGVKFAIISTHLYPPILERNYFSRFRITVNNQQKTDLGFYSKVCFFKLKLLFFI